MPSHIKKSLLSASSIFLQHLTPSTTSYYLKDYLYLVRFLLTRLSSGFSPIFLLALYPSRHRNHNANHSLSCTTGVPQGSVLGPLQYILYSTLLHSVHSSKHPQLTIIYTLMTPNYSSLSLQTASLTP